MRVLAAFFLDSHRIPGVRGWPPSSDPSVPISMGSAQTDGQVLSHW